MMPGIPTKTMRIMRNLIARPILDGGLDDALSRSPTAPPLRGEAPPARRAGAPAAGAAASVVRIRDVILRVGSLRSMAVLLLAPQLAQLHPGRLHGLAVLHDVIRLADHRIRLVEARHPFDQEREAFREVVLQPDLFPAVELAARHQALALPHDDHALLALLL